MTDIIVNQQLDKQLEINDVLKLKEEGNKFFNAGKYDDALASYTKALKISSGEPEKAVLYKNRAAAYLKLSEYEKAIKDCSLVLEIVPNDTKALFRRCQAFEYLEKYDEAYKDARQVHNLDPKNTAVQPLLGRLHAQIQELYKRNANTSNRIDQMFDYLFGDNPDMEKRIQAANNLIVLARDEAGAKLMFQRGLIPRIIKLMKVEKNPEIILSCIRTISELAKDNIPRTKAILTTFGVPQIIEGLNSQRIDQVTAAQYCIQVMINTLSGMDLKEDKKADKDLMKENEAEIDTILKTLLCTVNSRIISAVGRDAILELLMKNVEYKALDWIEKFLQTDGVQCLLEIASELREYKYESCIDITDSTRTIVAVCIGRIYDSLPSDAFRDRFKDQVDDFVIERLKGMDVEDKVRVTAAITTLLQGSLDIGNYCIGQKGVLEMMLIMAGTDDAVQQLVAAEAIIAAASKKDKCASIASLGTNILKKLYQSDNDNIRVRALVGLCKLGSRGGTDCSIKPFADGSSKILAKACRKFLISPAKDRDIRKWASEGLSYLTLDAEIKEELIEDKVALGALIELAKTGDQSVLYGVVTTFVNLTNSYDKEEIIPELVELAKFAKQHIPEENPLDYPECIEKRKIKLAEAGVVSALVVLSKTESHNSRELIARVLNAICEIKDLRGIVVQQGGGKALIPLALEGTDNGKKTASQALARLAITINPEVAFPGQRMVEAVRPLIQLLHPDCKGLQNFEALLALANLAEVSQAAKNRIVRDDGIPKIENYMYEDHVLLKRAAVQCMTNLSTHERVIELCGFENDRIKYWTLLCMDEDFETSKAAAGSLAMLTSANKKLCKKVFNAQSWLDCLKYLLVNDSVDLQHRGAVIIYNMMCSYKSVAEKLIETDMMEVLLALSLIEEPGRAKAKEYATLALKAAEHWKLIKPVSEEDEDLE